MGSKATSADGALEYLKKELKVEGTIIATVVFGNVVWVLLQVCLDWKNTKSKFFKCFFFKIILKHLKSIKLMLLQSKRSINSVPNTLLCVHMRAFWADEEEKKKTSNKVYIVVMLWDILSSHAIFLCMLFHSKVSLSVKKYLSHYFVPYPQLSLLLSAEALIFGFCSPMSTGWNCEIHKQIWWGSIASDLCRFRHNLVPIFSWSSTPSACK